MTAKVIRLAPPARPMDIASHLSGTARRQMGIMERMMGQDAMRLFVRSIATRHPLSDAGGRADIWAQVEDVCAYLHSMTSSTSELETYVHAVRRVLSAAQGAFSASSEGTIAAGSVRIAATDRRMRVWLDEAGTRRIVDFRLEADGAVRIGDHVAGG